LALPGVYVITFEYGYPRDMAGEGGVSVGPLTSNTPAFELVE